MAHEAVEQRRSPRLVDPPPGELLVPSGVGARAAQADAAARIPVTIARPGSAPVDAASILRVMALGVTCGETVELTATGPDAEHVLDSLVELLSTDLDGPAAGPGDS